MALGVTLPQFTDDPGRLLDAARCAEDVGIDSIWVFDHLWPLSGGKERPFFECWTSLASIAAATTSIRIGTLVTRSTLRHPAVLAKMAATVAAIAPGRLVVGIGSGDELSRPENEAFGLPFYGADRRAEQVRTVVQIVRGYVRGEPVTIDGDFARVDDLPPSPLSHPFPEVWVAGRTDDMIEVAGTYADGWNAWGSDPATFARDAAGVLEYAGDRAVTLSWGGQALLGRDESQARSLLGTRDPARFLVGGPGTLAEKLVALHEAGAHEAVVAFPSATPDRYRLLGEQVRPLVDELLHG